LNMQIIPKIPGNHKSRGIWLRQREREGGCEEQSLFGEITFIARLFQVGMCACVFV